MSERLFGQRPPETAYERGYVDGEQFAEERIIQALTNHLTRDSKKDWNPGLEYCYECGGFDYLLPDLIALIKGEQK